MKSSVLILSLFICCGLSAQTSNLNLSRWHINDKVEASDYQHIKKARLYCFFSNDYDNIYINIKVEDRDVQSRILKEGLTIWINMDGKPVKNLGVRFPIGSQNQGSRRKADRHENKSIPDGNTATPLSLANTIELIGFINEQQRHFPSDNHDSFRGSVIYNESGTLFYKLVLPLAKLPVRNSRIGHVAMPFTLGIEYGSSPTVNKQGNRGPKPSSVFHSGRSGGGSSELNWIYNFKLATSR
jgi:hypothetical protein